MIASDEAEAAQVPEIRRDPPERAVRAFVPACAGVWTAAEIMHVTGIPWLDITLGSLAVAGFAGLRTSHKTKDRKKARRHARHVAAGIMLTGAWSAAAARLGPLAGPDCALTLAWAGTSVTGWLWLRRHEVVIAARDWRNARTDWLSSSRRWGLGGSHLLHHERTRLGERIIADVKGTGKRASQLAHGDVAERIAEERNLPVSRVQVKPHRLAGRIEISIRELDPWANPITHPVLCEDPEIALAVPCSVKRPVEVGQDPETGRALLLPLWDERGGKNITIVAQAGGGKTILLNCASERVTAARDALMIRVNLSIKGLAEARRWGPACHLTAFGPRQQARALRVLRIVNKIIEWRSQQEYETDVFVPSPEDQEIVLIMDEIDSAAQIPAIRQQLEDIASKGREYGVTLIRAGQRGTAEWTGGGNVRANDSVFCIGMVRGAGEAMHAAGDLGLSMPNMATYGEGHGGVWVIAQTGGEQDIGRTFMLKDPPDITRIVAERAHYQPDLKPELKAFLGESYEVLLSTDEYAKWARDQQERPAPLPAHLVPDLTPGAGATAAVATTTALDAYDREAEDYLDTLGPEDDLRRRWIEQGKRNDETRRMIAETAAMPEPDVSPEDRAEYVAAKWDREAEDTEIPPDIREKLLALVAGEGISARQAVNELGVEEAKRAKVTWWLNRLRWEGVVSLEGKGRGARWKLAPPPDGGDSQ